jgi:hypothetical protein
MEKIRNVKEWPKSMWDSFRVLALGAMFDPNSLVYTLSAHVLKHIQFAYARAVVSEDLPPTVPYADNGDPLVAVFRQFNRNEHTLLMFEFWVGYHTLQRSFEGSPVVIWLTHNRCNEDSMDTARQATALLCSKAFGLRIDRPSKRARTESGNSEHVVMFELAAIDRSLVPLKSLLENSCDMDQSHLAGKGARLSIPGVEIDFEKLHDRY